MGRSRVPFSGSRQTRAPCGVSRHQHIHSPLALEPLFSALAPARIVNERYGTRCSSVLLWGAAVRFAERAFDAGGAEQETLHYEWSARRPS